VSDLNDPALNDRIGGLCAVRDEARADLEWAQVMLDKRLPSGDHAADGAAVCHERPQSDAAG